MSLLQKYAPAINEAACATMQATGNGIVEAGVGAILLGGAKAGPYGALAAGALALFATQIACPYDAGGKGPTGGTYCGLDMGKVCLEVEVGDHILMMETWYGDSSVRQYSRLLSIGCAYSESDGPVSGNWHSHYRDIVSDSGPGSEPFVQQAIIRTPSANPDSAILYSVPVDVDDKPSKCTDKPRVEPVETKDGDGCDITVQIVGMGVSPGGNIAPIALIEPGLQKQKWLDEKMWERPEPDTINPQGALQHGQICQVSPTIAYNYGDQYIGVPYDPGTDFLDALDRLSKEVGNRADQIDSDLEGLDDKLDDILDKLPEASPGAPISIPSGTVTFQAVCDKDDQGNPEQVQYQLGGATTTNEALVQIYSNQTKLFAMIQQHLNWKTPICKEDKPELEGRFVTIHFESDQNSPGGERPLRKLFRYRTQSSRTVGQLREYWFDFVWQAGPYSVIHSGASWGTPQVWAASPDEGKRVIQHAAREAGIDPDQVGKWTISGSDNSRYGMSGQMRKSPRLGEYWLTSRDGPSGFDS